MNRNNEEILRQQLGDILYNFAFNLVGSGVSIDLLNEHREKILECVTKHESPKRPTDEVLSIIMDNLLEDGKLFRRELDGREWVYKPVQIEPILRKALDKLVKEI